MYRLTDALSNALYPMLPKTLQLNATELSINVTSAHRGQSFALLCAVHGPAGSVVKKTTP